MANQEHVKILKKGVSSWNEWREKNRMIVPDLTGVDLKRASLHKVNFNRTNLSHANLSEAYLYKSNLSNAILIKTIFAGTDLTRSNLEDTDLTQSYCPAAILTESQISRAFLFDSDLTGSNLVGANLTETELAGVNFSYCVLNKTNFNKARIGSTIFGSTQLRDAKGLSMCKYSGPSVIDFQTIQNSWPLPLEFLRGVGLPEDYIENLPALIKTPIQFYSCFISYSHEDDEFGKRLHADLQDKGIRCWFAPEDMKIGDKIRSRIDDAIRIHDKLLLILSENSINSEWVEKEVETAFEKERIEKRIILFPIRLDESVMETDQAWAADIRRTRHIGDFRKWKDHDEYQNAFKRLLRDLKAEN